MIKARKLPSGKWNARVYIGEVDGKKVSRSFTASTKSEAQRMAAAFEIEQKAVEKEQLITRRIPTLSEAMADFVQTCRAQGYSPSTIRGYNSIAKNAFSDLAEKKVNLITAADIQKCVDARSLERSVKTVRNEFFFLESVLKLHAPELRLDRIILAKRKKPKKRTFSRSWSKDILAEARKDPEFYLYVSLIMLASLRPSEAYALTWADISAEPLTAIGSGGKPFQFGEISVTKAAVLNEYHRYSQKGTKSEAGERIVSVAWPFFRDLYSLRPRGDEEDRILQMPPKLISYRWRRLRERLGLPSDFRFYDLRHYFATAMVASGATEEELQSAMGHSTATFTHSVYVETFEEARRSVSEKMAAETARLYADSR